jgi:hypothetical protein
MTATQIIAEIDALPPSEKRQVIRFTRSLEAQMPLSGDELTALAERLAASDDPAETAELNDQLMKGFYGNK